MSVFVSKTNIFVRVFKACMCVLVKAYICVNVCKAYMFLFAYKT